MELFVFLHAVLAVVGMMVIAFKINLRTEKKQVRIASLLLALYAAFAGAMLLQSWKRSAPPLPAVVSELRSEVTDSGKMPTPSWSGR